MELWTSSASVPAWVLPAMLAVVISLLVLTGVLLRQRGRLLNKLARLRAGPGGRSGLLSSDQVAQALDAEVARCDAQNGTLCLLLINLDNLQAVNDGYGHREADRLIT